MKFSPNDQYLATGGQDGLAHIWPVTRADVSCKGLYDEGEPNSDKAFQIDELSLQRVPWPYK